MNSGLRPNLFALLLALTLLPGAGLLLSLTGCGDPPQAPSPSRPPHVPDPEQVEFGRRLFRRSNPAYGCATCHGLDARGSRMGPSLRGAGKVYFEKVDPDPERVIERLVLHLTDPEAYPALASEEEYLAPMPPYSKLPREELEALAVFVLSLGGLT